MNTKLLVVGIFVAVLMVGASAIDLDRDERVAVGEGEETQIFDWVRTLANRWRNRENEEHEAGDNAEAEPEAEAETPEAGNEEEHEEPQQHNPTTVDAPYCKGERKAGEGYGVGESWTGVSTNSQRKYKSALAASVKLGENSCPDFQKVIDAYPFGASPSITKSMGHSWITNTCALRMSNCMIGAGIIKEFQTCLSMPIPPNGNMETAKCQTTKIRGDHEHAGRRFLYRVSVLKEVNDFALGPPSFSVTKTPNSAAVETYKKFKGKNGIIQFDIKWSDATGHFDLWSAAQRPIIDSDESFANQWQEELYNCGSMVEHNHQSENLRYFHMATTINLWEFPCASGKCVAPPAE